MKLIQMRKKWKDRLFLGALFICSMITFLSSLAINFLNHSFSDGWWTAIAQSLNNETLLYRNVKLFTTPFRAIIAYYLNQFSTIILVEKLFGFCILLLIWIGLWWLNFSLFRNVFIALGFTTISVTIGQSMNATNYYDYNLILILLAILMLLSENQRLRLQNSNFGLDCLWLMVFGFLSMVDILNKYSNGISVLFFIVIYFVIHFCVSKEEKSFGKIFTRFLAFISGMLVALLVIWLLGFRFTDFYAMSDVLRNTAEAKGVTLSQSKWLLLDLLQGFFSRHIYLIKSIFKDISIYNGHGFWIIFAILEKIFLIILPSLLVINTCLLIKSLHSDKVYVLSRHQRFLCLAMSLLGLGSLLAALPSTSGGWTNLQYFFNVIPVSVFCFVDFKGNGILKTKIIKISVIFLILITIPMSIYKILYPYYWFLPSGKIRLRNVEISSSGYYAYLPIDKKFGNAIREICSTIVDEQAAVISYPVPFANLACNRKYVLRENIFWYDVADQRKIQELLDWLKKSHNSPVYVVFFYDPYNLFIHEKMFGSKPAHRELESYLLSQEALGNNAQYILKDSIRYEGLTVKIYQSISR